MQYYYRRNSGTLISITFIHIISLSSIFIVRVSFEINEITHIILLRYISLAKKFLSFYREITDALCFISFLLNYIWSILF